MPGTPACAAWTPSCLTSSWTTTRLPCQTAKLSDAAGIAAGPRYGGATVRKRDRSAMAIFAIEVNGAIDLHGSGRQPEYWSIELGRQQADGHPGPDGNGREVVHVIAFGIEGRRKHARIEHDCAGSRQIQRSVCPRRVTGEWLRLNGWGISE